MIPQDEVGATPEAVVKEVAFNRWTKYACAKDVTEFNAAKKADIIFGRDRQSVVEIRIESVPNILTAKSSVSATVLIDIGPRVDRSVETEPVKFGCWRRRRDLFVGFRSGLQRSCEESNQDCC